MRSVAKIYPAPFDTGYIRGKAHGRTQVACVGIGARSVRRFSHHPQQLQRVKAVSTSVTGAVSGGVKGGHLTGLIIVQKDRFLIQVPPDPAQMAYGSAG